MICIPYGTHAIAIRIERSNWWSQDPSGQPTSNTPIKNNMLCQRGKVLVLSKAMLEWQSRLAGIPMPHNNTNQPCFVNIASTPAWFGRILFLVMCTKALMVRHNAPLSAASMIAPKNGQHCANKTSPAARAAIKQLHKMQLPQSECPCLTWPTRVRTARVHFCGLWVWALLDKQARCSKPGWTRTQDKQQWNMMKASLYQLFNFASRDVFVQLIYSFRFIPTGI